MAYCNKLGSSESMIVNTNLLFSNLFEKQNIKMSFLYLFVSVFLNG